jgi:hypothetical protein
MKFTLRSVEKLWASFQVLAPSRLPHYQTSICCIQGRRDMSADWSILFDSWESVTADCARHVTSAAFTDNDPFSSQVPWLFSYDIFFILQATLLHRINVSFWRPGFLNNTRKGTADTENNFILMSLSSAHTYISTSSASSPSPCFSSIPLSSSSRLPAFFLLLHIFPLPLSIFQFLPTFFHLYTLYPSVLS